MMIGVYSVLSGVMEDTFLQNSECMIGESFDSRLALCYKALVRWYNHVAWMHCRRPVIQMPMCGCVMTPHQCGVDALQTAGSTNISAGRRDDAADDMW